MLFGGIFTKELVRGMMIPYLYEKKYARATEAARTLVNLAILAWPEAGRTFKQYGVKPYDQINSFDDLDQLWSQMRKAPPVVRAMQSSLLGSASKSYQNAKKALSEATDALKAAISRRVTPPALTVEGTVMLVADAAFWQKEYEGSITYWSWPIANRRFMLELIAEYWANDKIPPPTYKEALEELMPPAGAGRKPDNKRRDDLRRLVVKVLVDEERQFDNATKFFEALVELDPIWKDKFTEAKDVRRYFDRWLGPHFPGSDLSAWSRLAGVWKAFQDLGIDSSSLLIT